MDPPLSTLPLKRSVSGPGPTTRTSFVPPPSPSTSTRSKRPKLASPLDLASTSHSSRSAAKASSSIGVKKDRKPLAKPAAVVGRGGGGGGGEGRKGKARMMMDEEEQLELRRLDNEDGDEEEEEKNNYVWDLVGIKREELEAETFLFLSQAYASLRESMIARVVDPFIDYAENHTSPTNPTLSHLTAHLSPILAHLKPLLIRRTLDVLKDGDEDLYLITSPICTEEMLDREEFIYAPLRTLLHTLYQTELSHSSNLNLARTPGPGGKTAGNVKNALGWVLLRIAQRGLEDSRWKDGRGETVERVGGRRTEFGEDEEVGSEEGGSEEGGEGETRLG